MLRPFNDREMRNYLHELRPRLLTVHIHHKRMKLRWFVPMWSIEEPMRFLLRTFRLVQAIAPRVVTRLETRLKRTNAFTTWLINAPTGSHRIWPAIDAFFSERHRDLLAIPNDEPLLEIDTRNTKLRIAQTRI